MKDGHAGGRRGLPPEVRGVIATVLHRDGQASDHFFQHPRLGQVYRAYVISQVLDAPDESHYSAAGPPPSSAARILTFFHLTGDGSEKWQQLYEHIGTVVAAATTIGKRMGLGPDGLAKVKAAALLHDATKREDVEQHGKLASSLENVGHHLAEVMSHEGYPEDTIAATMNTGRQDRKFDSEKERQRSIAGKGVIAAIVGLADTRAIGADFRALPEALADYLNRKKDRESQDFFSRYWMPYYQGVEAYLTKKCPGLDLQITNEDIYNETIFLEVFGTRSSYAVTDRYRYSAISEV
jgi:hypothetical protein